MKQWLKRLWKWSWRALLSTLGLLGIILLSLWILFPTATFQSLIKSQVADLLEGYGVDLTFDQLDIGFLPPRATIDGLVVMGADAEPLLEVEQIFVALQGRKLLRGAIAIDEVTLSEPRVNLVIDGGAIVNLPELTLPEAEEEPEEAQEESSLSLVGGVHLDNGSIQLVICDPSGGDENISAQIAGLDISLDSETVDGSRYVARLVIATGELKQGGSNLALSLPETTVVIDDDGAALSELRLELGDAEVALSDVEVALSEPFDVDAQLEASIPIAYISDFIPQVPPLSGVLRLEGQVERREEVLLAEVDIGGEELAINLSDSESPPLTLSALDVEVAYVDGDLVVPSLVIERPGEGGGRVEITDGILGLEDPALPLLAEVTIDGVALNRVLSECGVLGVPVDTRIDGDLSVDGGLIPLALNASITRLEGHDLVVAVDDDAPIVNLNKIVILAQAVVEPHRARLENFSLALGRATLRGSAEFPFDPASPTFSIRAAPVGSELYLEDLGPIASMELAGHGNVDINISGLYADPLIEGNLSLADLRADSIAIDGVNGLIRYQSSELTIPEATASLRRSTIRVENGLLSIGQGGVRAQATALLDPLDLSDAMSLAKLGDPAQQVKGRLTARAEVSYDTASKSLDAQVEGDLRTVGFGDVTIGSGPVKIVAEKGLISIRELSLQSDETAIKASGSVDINRAQDLDLELSVRGLPTTVLAPLIPDSAPHIEGVIGIEAAVKGTISDPEIAGRVELNESSISGHAIGSTELEVAFANQEVVANGQIGGELLQIQELRLGLDDEGLPLRIRATAREVQLTDVLPQGTLPEGTEAGFNTLTIDASANVATLTDLDGQLSIDGLSGRQGDAHIRTTSPLNLRFSGDRVSLDETTLTVGQGDSQSTGRITLEGIHLGMTETSPLEGRIRFDELEISHLAPEGSLPEGLLAELDGSVELSGELTSISDLSVDLRLESVSVVHGDARIRNARPVSITLEDGAVETHEVVFIVTDENNENGGRIRLDLLRLGIAEPWPLRLRAFVQDLDVPLVANIEREGLEANLGAVVNLTGNLDQPWALRGGVALRDISVERGDVRAHPADHIVIRFNGRGIDLEPTEIIVASGSADQSTSFRLGGSASPEVLDLSFAGRVDMELLAALVEPVERARGALDVDVQIRGTFESPVIVGEASLNAPRVVLAGFQEPITSLRGDIRFSQNALVIEGVRAEFLSGRILGSGQVDLSVTPPAYNANLVVRDINIPFGHQSALSSNVDITLASPREGEELPLLSGEIELTRLRFSDDLELGLNLNDLLRRQMASVQLFNPDEAILRLDLDLTSTDDLRVENNLMRATVRLDTARQPFTIVGTDLAPGVLGLLEVEPEGVVAFRGQRFIFQRGVLTFDRRFEIDPSLDVVAMSVIRDWTVSLVVSGRASDLDIGLRSDPNLNREDILLLLAVGMTRAETEQMGYAAALASLAPELLWAGLGDEAGQILPFLQSIQVTSEYNTDTGQIEPRVSVGWPVSERIRVGASTGLGLSNTDREMQVGVEYHINDAITLEGTYGANNDIFLGEIGIDVRWYREF